MEVSLSSTFSVPRQLMVTYARKYVLSVLSSGIRHGTLVILESSKTYEFGQGDRGKSTPTIVVVSDSFWLRLFLRNDLGFSESYMLGEIEVEHLRPIHDLWLDNMTQLEGLSTYAHIFYSTLTKWTSYILGQSISQAKLNAVAGYDESNTLFKLANYTPEAFLSEDMMYSSALFSDEEGGVYGDMELRKCGSRDLENAEMRKIHHFLRRARIRKGDRILEFGSGWCSTAIEAARTYGCTVDTLTLSVAQKAFGEERIREAGLSSLITVHLLDYRSLPASFEKAFDAFISIEMLEHVGPRYYEEYFRIVNWALKVDRAIAVISSSTMPESRYDKYQAPDFARQYLWPNGTLPSVTALITAAQVGSSSQLNLDTIENHGEHYARTLREWEQRFRANVDRSVMNAVAQERPDLAEASRLESFRKKWLYLFSYAAAGYERGYVTCHMLTFTRIGGSVSG
ncbi:uncharacterized protein FIBRA_01245 [Fibroporia radiculosa]|uniref:Cyclopropane-fatty-acyl-phospholipid synthase n=1 Tax=Fibroporia radiculosa TaxID=599839 RepID=J4GJN8_9APHY|nr:uncharacterized protein FIBRA_01245 [Fibroporia radiculosa]CCL99230.1 predicted protein [Fibroporia radiculosa]